MEKEPKILEKLSKWWQLRNKCFVVFLALILLFVIIGWFADRFANSYRYLGTASVLLSIVLSLVVVGYTLAQNVISHINADRIRRLIERLEQRILRVGEQVSKILIQQATQVTPRENEETIPDDTKQVGKGDVFLVSWLLRT